MLKQTIDRALQSMLPSKIYLRLLKWKRGFEEPELKLVYDLCDRSLVSVDVGAANGLYLAHMYAISKKCYAIEPRKEAVENLQKVFSGITTKIEFENVALSNFSGTAQMKMVKNFERLSTIENDNEIDGFGDIELVEVPVKRLDDFDFKDKVGFIKLDVEGHEQSVLLGALNLIERDHPSLLIEIEERHKHNAVNNVKELLETKGYKGFFYLDGRLASMELFDLKKYQQYGVEGQKYIFNFIYVHPESMFRINHLLK